MAATAGPLSAPPPPPSSSAAASSASPAGYPPPPSARRQTSAASSSSSSHVSSSGTPLPEHRAPGADPTPDSPVALSFRSSSRGSGVSLSSSSAKAAHESQSHLAAGSSSLNRQQATATATATATAGAPLSLTSSISSSSAASYDAEGEEDDENDNESNAGALSANRAGRSGKPKHALFFSTSRTRELSSSSGTGAAGRRDAYASGRSTPLAHTRDDRPYLARQSIEETQPLRPGSSTPGASSQLGSASGSAAPPFFVASSSRNNTSKMHRSTVKSLSGSSHAGDNDDDDNDAIVDEVELTPASPGRLSRSNSATAELQTAFGFGGGSGSAPYGHLPARTVQERRRAYWRSAALNLLLIASWYLFSTLISLYNKWMFDKKHYNFAYPLFVTCFHMIVQAVLSALALCIFERQLVVRRPNGRRERPSFSDWSTKVVPCGVATAMDIGLSNLSLKTITLTFYTMCKSSNLAFVLFFAFLFRLEKIRLSLIGIIALITIGVIMMVAAETQFVLVGAVEVLTASAMGGLRWALAQMLLEGRGRNSGMGMARNPIATIFWLAPVMAVSMAVASMVVEDWRVVLASRHFKTLAISLRTLGLVTAPGVLAFCMHLSEFALIQRTSVVTLSVAGIFKEVSTIILASTIFGDELTPINVTGLCITILGIALYNWLKYRLNVNAAAGAAGSGGAGGAVEGGGSYGGTGSANVRDRGEYTQIFNREEEEEDDDDVDGRGGPSRKKAQRQPPQPEREEVISPEEAERRRKREEEADMDGWSTAGVQQTGNGWYE
ncbi:hypothetical protein OC834_005180 [Tilletia horrida]|nr:hypothetical protein OC834_005180 [Tilletia horrida]